MMDEEEWFFNSFKRYNELQMFDFPQNIAQIDITSTRNLCVALEEDISRKNEILIFQLPSVLQPKGSSRFTKLERHLSFDHGYFTESSLIQMKCTARNDNLIISEKNGVALFDLTCEDSDIIRKISNVPGTVECALIAVNPEKNYVILCDGKTGHRSVVDYEKMEVVLRLEDCSKESLLAPMFTSADIASFGVTDSGCISSYDLRSGKFINSFAVCDYIQTKNSIPKQWIFSSSYESGSEWSNASFLYAWADDGHLMLFDWRNTSQPIFRTLHPICHQSDQYSKRRMSVCPLNPYQFASSGFDGNVYICELKNEQVVTVFTHDGHAYCHDEFEPDVKSKCSMWLPFISANTLVSSSDNHSLQCWQYKIS